MVLLHVLLDHLRELGHRNFSVVVGVHHFDNFVKLRVFQRIVVDVGNRFDLDFVVDVHVGFIFAVFTYFLWDADRGTRGNIFVPLDIRIVEPTNVLVTSINIYFTGVTPIFQQRTDGGGGTSNNSIA
eukprot:SAG31_NODE_15440_length_755_cov_0.952744_1_plen_127_part_00